MSKNISQTVTLSNTCEVFTCVCLCALQAPTLSFQNCEIIPYKPHSGIFIGLKWQTALSHEVMRMHSALHV